MVASERSLRMSWRSPLVTIRPFSLGATSKSSPSLQRGLEPHPFLSAAQHGGVLTQFTTTEMQDTVMAINNARQGWALSRFLHHLLESNSSSTPKHFPTNLQQWPDAEAALVRFDLPHPQRGRSPGDPVVAAYHSPLHSLQNFSQNDQCSGFTPSF